MTIIHIFGRIITSLNEDELLQSIGLAQDAVPRYRGCYLGDGKIVVRTRTGGGNREVYDSEETFLANYPDEEAEGPWNSDLRDNPYLYRKKMMILMKLTPIFILKPLLRRSK